jgi:glycerate 2-kinase
MPCSTRGDGVIERAICEAAFREAVIACDPALRVREWRAREPLFGRDLIGIAIGKAAFAMARGAGPVARGLVVVPRGRVAAPPPAVQPRTRCAAAGAVAAPVHALPAGWSMLHASHPIPDETSFAAGAAVIAMTESAGSGDIVLALVSGGASSLVEQPREGISLDGYRDRVREVMASGAPIHELNRVRTELSAIKGGKLAARCAAPIVTLIVSDVIGDDPRVIGSGPTVAEPPRDGDRVVVLAPTASFGEEVMRALHARGIAAPVLAEPIAEDVAVVAEQLAGRTRDGEALVAWGEPTVRVPKDAGRGGRAQQLALELARRLRGSPTSAFVAGSDGIDGPSARGAAGAYVDGATWDAIVAAGIDPGQALARCDAGTALDTVGALVVTGPTGINHADVAIVG